MSSASVVQSSPSEVTIYAYRGDGSVLLAFDVAASATADLAGFAVSRKDPSGKTIVLNNRLSFSTPITANTTPEDREWHSSFDAPFQHFRWVDFPGDVIPGVHTYTATAMYFQDGTGTLRKGQSASVTVTLGEQPFKNFIFGFTRGYLSSQAYAQKFKNAPIRPAGAKTIDYSTAPFKAQYDWLGASARQLMIYALSDCQDPSVTVDLFAFDLDEPDFIGTMAKLGTRLRAYLDNSPLHSSPDSCEQQALKLLQSTAGAGNIKTGHFHRFAHDKVLIFKRNGKPYRVLTGSANFSVRGLYVQANNMLLFDNADVAGLYEQVFEQCFNDPNKDATKGFQASPMAQKWFDVSGPGMPDTQFCFSPHASNAVSLQPVEEAIAGAQSSVLFAIMELGGTGPVMKAIQDLPQQANVFGYGVTQSEKGAKVYTAGNANGEVVPFSYLSNQVPKPFRAETSGGAGQVIHDKFVVVDFNGKNPAVFTGSSNLAAGGEESNGDNLLKITDTRVVTAFAVEAIRMVDHYAFRAKMKGATAADPLMLQGPGAKKPWWQPYFDSTTLKYREREVLCNRAETANRN
jgi:phosphatidylserine/phosphatidylglycerophosphate/cardiolipin synthase-like enzyme